MSLTLKGNDFNVFLQFKQPKNRARIAKMELKIESVYNGDTRILTILRIEKVICCTFSKFFGKMLSIFVFAEMSLAIGENDLIFLICTN